MVRCKSCDKNCDCKSCLKNEECLGIWGCGQVMGCVEKKRQPDIVNNPPHYTSGGIETLDYIKAKLTPDGYEGYLQGNILKYLSRYRHKNGAEDLKKAIFYTERLIEHLEGEK